MSEWRKSSYSAQGNCVEVAWRKSSHSTVHGACAEVAQDGGRVLVRDSKDPGPVLEFSTPEWVEFLERLRDEHRTAVGRGVLGGWIYYCTVDGYSDEVYRTRTAARDAAAAHCDKR